MNTGTSTKKNAPTAMSAMTVPVAAREPAPETAPPAPRPTALSPREQEVLAHLAQGCTYRIIARRMGLSPHTVDTYVRRLRGKTGSVNRIQLAHLAFQLGYGPGY
ncbi:regulatory protein, luxR family [Streptomyces sp. yr375]|uniref:response regulator transcription factor n=1 Tax=Streptomyces sp. yr375 TaxID=1761906 RepID=UPI0008C8E758|nr:helix-turn-helix transcriptional regulator [Streptomyces sp. yr375]SEP61618.1 regulatory protein, luxR family [Streptomyces sp. yr375]